MANSCGHVYGVCDKCFSRNRKEELAKAKKVSSNLAPKLFLIGLILFIASIIGYYISR